MSRRVWPPEVLVVHSTDAQAPLEGWHAGRVASPVREQYHYLIGRGPGTPPVLYGGSPMYTLLAGTLPRDVDLERWCDRVRRCGGLVQPALITVEAEHVALGTGAVVLPVESCFSAFLAWCSTSPTAPATYAFRWAMKVPWKELEIWEQARTACGLRVWRPVPPTQEDEACGP